MFKFSDDSKFVMIDDETVFPIVTAETDDIEWTLRYGSEKDIIKHRLYIASIVHSYDTLIQSDYCWRNKVLSNLKKATNIFMMKR